MTRVLGLDLGTQSAKAVIYDAALAVRGVGRAAIATRFPRPGWAEQDPGDWERAIGRAVAGALADAGCAATAIAAVAITGQLDGLVAVDEGGAALGPAWPWLDRRAVAAAARVAPARLRAIAGQVADASHLAAKAHHWDQHGARRAAAFHVPVSYLVERLTGARVLDPSHASTTMLYDLAASAWSAELCAVFEIEAARLPAIAPASATAGVVTTAGAAWSGLAVGTPVAVGTGDDFATPLGIGLAADALLCAVGTAEVVGCRGPIEFRDPIGLVETHPYPASAGFIENPGWSAGGAIAWLAALTGHHPEALDRAAAAAGPGADGVRFVPALGGAMVPRWDPVARGAFVGLGPGHGPGHLARAIYEACATAMDTVGGHLRDRGLTWHTIALVGGGAAAETWAQVRADLAGRPVARYAEVDAAPRGAAMLALAVAEACALADVIARAPPPTGWLDPAPELAATYRAIADEVLAATAAIGPLDHAHAAATP